MADGDRTREDLRALVGATRIVEDPATIARASRDTWVISVWRWKKHGDLARHQP